MSKHEILIQWLKITLFLFGIGWFIGWALDVTNLLTLIANR